MKFFINSDGVVLKSQIDRVKELLRLMELKTNGIEKPNYLCDYKVKINLYLDVRNVNSYVPTGITVPRKIKKEQPVICTIKYSFEELEELSNKNIEIQIEADTKKIFEKLKRKA